MTMTMEVIRAALGWCAIINIGVLLWWSLFMLFAGDFVYRMHGKWFPMPRERFTEIHYKGIMSFKLAIFLFNIVPYLALRIVG